MNVSLQPPAPHQPSFVDQNAAFQDLSESFRSLYKSVFENSQGTYDALNCRQPKVFAMVCTVPISFKQFTATFCLIFIKFV